MCIIIFIRPRLYNYILQEDYLGSVSVNYMYLCTPQEQFLIVEPCYCMLSVVSMECTVPTDSSISSCVLCTIHCE